YNTGKHDGSIYSQIYLGCLMISGGCRLFSIREPLVLKDIQMSGDQQNSYRDTIARKWKDYKVVDGGMPSVINVVLDALKDANALDQQSVYSIFNRIYSLTFPHWILDYKANKAFPEAIGLIVGMNPSRNENFKKLSIINRFRIHGKYFASATIGLVTPAVLFKKYKNKVYKLFKK
ncbi:MAG TPA: hypothetical protein VM368_00940, partial [Flavisolibacter sp.]|nr:hypothetical protein [Flavisolibacter sp.]